MLNLCGSEHCCNSLQMHRFLIPRLTPSTPRLGFLHYNAFLSFNLRCFSQSSTTNHYQDGSFTVSNLVNSCGLSPEMALKLSERLQLKNPDAPKAVIDLLRSYGFSETQLSILVKKHPFVLLAKPEKTLLPKLQFYHSIGVSITDLPNIILKNTSFLTKSLKKNTIPRYEVLRSIVSSDKEIVSTLKHGPWHFYYVDLRNDLVPNIEVLRELGLPQSSISLLVTNFPNVAFAKHSRFVEAVKTVKEMGFDPMNTNFVLAVQVLAKMSEAVWESKLEVFERWGWSRQISLLAFKKYPQFIIISEKKIMKTMSFLVKDMGWCSEDIARCPAILNRNLEKTFIPRCAVIKILKSKDLIKIDLHPSTFILLSEKKFLERYVTRFQQKEPLLLYAYKGKKSD